MTPFTQTIHRALDFVSTQHEGQYRKDPDLKIPYISHLFGVVYILAQYGFPEKTIVAGALHDLVEDIVVKHNKPEVLEEARQQFGKEVLELIDWVTQRKKDAGGNKVSWQYRNNAYIDRITTAPPEAKAISCADKIHNIQSILLGFERGQKMWAQLKATPPEQIAKFRALHKSLSTGWNHSILNELEKNITILEQWVNRV